MREYGEVRFRFVGGDDLAKRYVGIARTQLGLLKSTLGGGVTQAARRVALLDGTVLLLDVRPGQDTIEIDVSAVLAVAELPVAASAASVVLPLGWAYRFSDGLLRAEFDFAIRVMQQKDATAYDGIFTESDTSLNDILFYQLDATGTVATLVSLFSGFTRVFDPAATVLTRLGVGQMAALLSDDGLAALVLVWISQKLDTSGNFISGSRPQQYDQLQLQRLIFASDGSLVSTGVVATTPTNWQFTSMSTTGADAGLPQARLSVARDQSLVVWAENFEDPNRLVSTGDPTLNFKKQLETRIVQAVVASGVRSEYTTEIDPVVGVGFEDVFGPGGGGTQTAVEDYLISRAPLLDGLGGAWFVREKFRLGENAQVVNNARMWTVARLMRGDSTILSYGVWSDMDGVDHRLSISEVSAVGYALVVHNGTAGVLWFTVSSSNSSSLIGTPVYTAGSNTGVQPTSTFLICGLGGAEFSFSGYSSQYGVAQFNADGDLVLFQYDDNTKQLGGLSVIEKTSGAWVLNEVTTDQVLPVGLAGLLGTVSAWRRSVPGARFQWIISAFNAGSSGVFKVVMAITVQKNADGLWKLTLEQLGSSPVFDVKQPFNSVSPLVLGPPQ